MLEQEKPGARCVLVIFSDMRQDTNELNLERELQRFWISYLEKSGAEIGGYSVLRGDPIHLGP